MLKIYFATIHPKFIQSYSEFGVFKSAQSAGILIEALNLRDFAVDKHGSVDDYPYGGGDSMVMRPEPIKGAIDFITEANEGAKPLIVYASPKGKTWDHQQSLNLAVDLQNSHQPILFLCGRFAGVDQRVIDLFVDLEFSLGDFVISGGELASMTMVDAILRHIPKVLGNKDSVEFDSFSDGLDGMLEYPVYTRPAEFMEEKVPPVLLSGNHKKIAEWRLKQSQSITQELRPDIIK